MARDENEKYRDILDLPHHTSETRPRMPMRNRAAQFAPFAALQGFEEELRETTRQTEPRRELSEDEKERLDRALRALRARIAEEPLAELTWFVRDRKKAGGAYVTEAVRLRKIDPVGAALVLTDGRRIPLDDVFEIEEK